jgi:hypothetical protein
MRVFYNKGGRLQTPPISPARLAENLVGIVFYREGREDRYEDLLSFVFLALFPALLRARSAGASVTVQIGMLRLESLLSVSVGCQSAGKDAGQT